MRKVLLLVVALLGCARSRAEEERATNAAPVRVAVATTKAVPIEVRAVGTGEALASVEVRPRVGGNVVKVGFREGQRVAKGEVLFEIDPRPYRIAREQAEAALARDEAQAAFARAQVRRYAKLLAAQSTDEEIYRQMVANARALDATVRVDEAALAKARLDLEWATIRAPIDGVVGSVLLHVGSDVKADEGPLVVLNQVRPLRVAFGVPQEELGRVRERAASGPLSALAELPAPGEPPAEGRLTSIDNTVDPSTGMIKLKAEFPNDDDRLWPGLLVSVVLVLGTRSDAVVVPTSAVQRDQSGAFVFVVKPDRTVERRGVRLGPRAGGEVAIDHGISAGETVVTEGQLRLAPGAHVSIEKAAS